MGEAENEYGRLEEAVNDAIRMGADDGRLNDLLRQQNDAWNRLQDLRALRDQLRDPEVTLVASEMSIMQTMSLRLFREEPPIAVTPLA